MFKILFFILIIFISKDTYSLEVTLTQGSVKPTPIAITDLFSSDSSKEKLGKNISNVISDNLERSGLFLPINKKSFIQDISNKIVNSIRGINRVVYDVTSKPPSTIELE